MKLTQEQKLALLAQKVEEGTMMPCPNCKADILEHGFHRAKLQWVYERWDVTVEEVPEGTVGVEQGTHMYSEWHDDEDYGNVEDQKMLCRECGADLPFNYIKLLEDSMW